VGMGSSAESSYTVVRWVEGVYIDIVLSASAPSLPYHCLLIVSALKRDSTATMPIHRITMFKIPKEEDVLAAQEAYKKLEADNKKVVRPILLR
jgi:hypothetical protein